MKIIKLNEYSKKSSPKKISLYYMIFNPKKREEYYREINSNYKETDDEKEIFREANKRRMDTK